MQHTAYNGDLFLHPDRPTAVTVSPNRVSRWDLEGPEPEKVVSWREDVERPAAAGPDWVALVTPGAGLDSVLELRDWEELGPEHQWNDERVGGWATMAVPPGGGFLYAIDMEGRLDVVALPDFEVVHSQSVEEFEEILGFSPTGDRLVTLVSYQSGCWLKLNRVEDHRIESLGRFELPLREMDFFDAPGRATFSEDGRRLYVFMNSPQSPDVTPGTVFAYDPDSRECLWYRELNVIDNTLKPTGNASFASDLALRDGNVYCGRDGGDVLGYSCEDGELRHRITVADRPVHNVAVGPKGRLLAKAGDALVVVD